MGKKKRLANLTVETNGETQEWPVVSILVGVFKNDRRINVIKTENGIYTLLVKSSDKDCEREERGISLVKEELAALFCSVRMFLVKEKMDIQEIVESCKDEQSGYLYKWIGEEE